MRATGATGSLLSGLYKRDGWAYIALTALATLTADPPLHRMERFGRKPLCCKSNRIHLISPGSRVGAIDYSVDGIALLRLLPEGQEQCQLQASTLYRIDRSSSTS